MESRPKIKLSLTPADTFIELLGWVTFLTLWGLTIYTYSRLPDKIPLHFDAAGRPDNYGGKGTHFILPIIGTVQFIGLTILNKYPHIFSYRVNITEENALEQYTIATRMMRFMKFAVTLLFTAIQYLTYTTATGKTSGLGPWFLPLTLGLIFIPVIYYSIRSFRAK